MRRFIRIVMLVAAVAAAGALVPIIVSSREEVREVKLVVRDMTYYVEGRVEPNPTLRFRAGERIRLSLRNEDPGMSHDFAIRAWNVGTPLLDGKGLSEVAFLVPNARGAVAYSCTPHSQMMRGSVEIE